MSENKNTLAGARRKVKQISASYQMLTADDIVKVAGQLAGTTVVTLPGSANTNPQERPIGQYKFTVIAGSQTTGASNVAIAPGGTDQINGSASPLVLNSPGSVDLYWDGTAWIATKAPSASTPTTLIRAWADGLSTVPLAPAAQTTSATPVDVMAAILVASLSGYYFGACQLAMTATTTNVLTCKVVTRTQAATIAPLGNNTASGTNCQFQTAAGGITYTGTPSANVHLVYTVTVLTGVLTTVFQWAGRLSANAAQQPFTLQNNVIMGIQHANSANTTTFSGSGAVGGANSIQFDEAAA